jgi:hypothetical protein
MNISKETTAQELCYIRNVPEIYRRSIGINLSGGFVNAVEICMQVYNAPSFNTLLAAFDAEYPQLCQESVDNISPIQERRAA